MSCMYVNAVHVLSVCYHLNNPNTEQEQVSGAAVGSMDGGDDDDEEDVTVWRTTMKLK